MDTLQNRLAGLAHKLGIDIRALRALIGNLAGLATVDKSSLVAAINEVYSDIDLVDQKIGGDKLAIGQSVGFASQKTVVEALAKLFLDLTNEKTQRQAADTALQAEIDAVEAMFNGLIDDGNPSLTKVYSSQRTVDLIYALEQRILGGMPPEMLDTLKELAAFLTDNNVVGGLVEQLSKKVGVTVQTFSPSEKQIARENIEAVGFPVFNALTADLGDVTQDLIAIYLDGTNGLPGASDGYIP